MPIGGLTVGAVAKVIVTPSTVQRSTHLAKALTSLNHGLQQSELLAVGESDRDAKQG